MKIYNRSRKGFTLVELIVVIAIVAILAAVSVVSYMAFVDKANESNDVQLVKQLNIALQSDETLNGKRDTMHDMLGVMSENGFFVENLTKTKSGNDIVYDKANNRFALINEEKVIFSEESYLKARENAFNIWRFASNSEEANNKNYSIYLTSNFDNGTSTSLTINAGLDVGNYEGPLTEINYVNETTATQDAIAQNPIIIRSNSAETTLNINGELDTVKHYDLVGSVNVTKIYNDSYHEYGTVGYLYVASGHAVLEEGSKVVTVVSANSEVKLDNNGGELGNAYGVNHNTNSGNIELSGSKTADELEEIKKDAVNKVIPDPYEEIIKNAPSWANYAIIGENGQVYGYDWPKILDDDNVPDQEFTYLLLGNCTSDFSVTTKKITVDLNGYILTLDDGGFGAMGQANLTIIGDKEGSKIVGGDGSAICSPNGRVNLMSGYYDIPVGIFPGLGVAVAPKNIHIYGGTFSKTNPETCTIEQGYHSVNNGDGTYSVVKD